MKLLLCLTLLLPPLAALPCALHPQGEADCRGRGLRHVPSLPADIQHLDLSNNSIHISKPLGTFPHLRLLNLSHNPLHILPSNAFHGLPGLRTLDLTDCGISSLQPHVLKGLHNLQTLVLGQNHLSSVSLGTLKDLHLLDARETPGSPSSLTSSTRRRHLQHLPARASLCVCRPGVIGLFCSCRSGPVPENPEADTPRVRVIREISGNESASNLTSPSAPVAHGRSWPYLVGFVLVAIFLSCLIALAAKFNILHKYLRSYRHRPLPESEWVSETPSELPGLAIPPPEDEDGFIEDNYIQPREHQEDDEEDEVVDGMYSI